MAVTGAGAERLVALAREMNVRLAAAHVFLFTRYVTNYAELVADAGRVRSVRIRWADPRNEVRYGEEKRYDASLPVFADWIPHICALLGALDLGRPEHFEGIDVLNGGAHLEIALRVGNIPVSVELVRNGDRRQRIMEIVAGGETLRLDSSQEPGTITRGLATAVADFEWETGQRPVARMLTTFLNWAAGGDEDSRLAPDLAVRASRIIDQVGREYRSVVYPWLRRRLAGGNPVDDDLHYALSELLQADGVLPAPAIEGKIERLIGGFAGPDRVRLLRRLADAKDPEGELRAFAR